MLDVGAGVGWWKTWLKKHRKHVRSLGTEMERSICKRYGHQQADIRTWRPERRFDLVVCHGVLPYVDAARCDREPRRGVRGVSVPRGDHEA